jgi:hypothetical protein
MLAWYSISFLTKSHSEEKRNQILTYSMMTTIRQKRNTKTELEELPTNGFCDRKLSSADGQTNKARRLKDKQQRREVHRVRGRSSPRETMKKSETICYWVLEMQNHRKDTGLQIKSLPLPLPRN